MKILAYLVFGLDKVLYNVFGVVTPIRRTYWRRRAKELQKALDYQHTFVSERNACHDIAHTGKYYVENYRMIDSMDILKHIGDI